MAAAPLDAMGRRGQAAAKVLVLVKRHIPPNLPKAGCAGKVFPSPINTLAFIRSPH
jgi:hypothetical protein